MAKINSISNASSQLTVDPGASGDSFVQFNINTTGEFRIGVDDTDSDAFVIAQGSSLGTNNTFRMSALGERTLPLQPGFLASNSARDTNVTGDGTVYTCEFDTEVFDIGGDYNNTTDTFTAPVTGIYMFIAIIDTIRAGVSTSCVINIVTTGQTYSQFSVNPGAIQTGPIAVSLGDMMPYCIVVAQMTATDTAKISIQFSGTTKTVYIRENSGLNRTMFNGFLVA